MPKKKKEVKPPPPPPPTKADYFAKLKVINTQLAKYRTQAAILEEKNEELRGNLLDYQNFRADLTDHLQANLQMKEDAFMEIDEETKLIHKSREAEKRATVIRVRELEFAFKKSNATLKAEAAILRAKLDSLEEFRAQRDEFMKDLGQQELDYKKNEKMRREGISRMLMESIANKEDFIKGFDDRLQQLMDDFEQTYEVRVAGYSRKLIRENVAKTTILDRMIKDGMKREDEHKVIAGKFKSLVDKNYIDELNLKRLQKTCQKQVDIIEAVGHEYDAMKVKHFNLLKFKELYEQTLESDKCDKVAIEKKTLRANRFETSIVKAKEDNEKVNALIQKDEEKMFKLRDKIRVIRSYVKSVIDKEKIILKKRKILLRERHMRSLTLCRTISEILEEGGIFTEPSGVGLSSLRVKSAVYKSREEIEEMYQPPPPPGPPERKLDKNIVPVERDIGPTTLMDAESGTPYIYSSSDETILMEDEGGMGEAEDFGASSSESAQGVPEEEQEKRVKSSVEMVRHRSEVSLTETADYTEEGDLFEDYGEYDSEDDAQFFY